MYSNANSAEIGVNHNPWNKGRLIGPKPPLKLREIWAIRIRLQLAQRTRDLALFNLSIDSKLRGYDLVQLQGRDVAHSGRAIPRATVMQQKTGQPVKFELTEQTREAIQAWIANAQLSTHTRLAFIIIVTTLAYLGLAVLGWGGFAASFSHPALLALAIVLFVLSGLALFSGGNLSPGERVDRANRWVIVAFALIGLLSAYLPAYTDRNGFWTLDGDAIRWIGVVLFAAGGALRIWAGLCARPSVKRFSSHPVRAHAGHERCLWSHPPPQLSVVARQLARVRPLLSLASRRIAHSAATNQSSSTWPRVSPGGNSVLCTFT